MIQLLAIAGTRFDHGVGFHCGVEAEVGEEDRGVIEYLQAVVGGSASQELSAGTGQ